MVVFIPQQIGGEEHDGLVAEILPPMGDLRGLGHHVAGFVHNRHCTVASVFVDLPFDDVNDRGTIGVAVPRHDAPGLDGAASTVSVTPLPAWLTG